MKTHHAVQSNFHGALRSTASPEACWFRFAGNELCVGSKCGSGKGAKLGGEEVYKGYDNYPN
eukprot:SAG11_NODE_12981_length_676_cov_0.620451_1_plen_61_part_10